MNEDDEYDGHYEDEAPAKKGRDDAGKLNLLFFTSIDFNMVSATVFVRQIVATEVAQRLLPPWG